MLRILVILGLALVHGLRISPRSIITMKTPTDEARRSAVPGKSWLGTLLNYKINSVSNRNIGVKLTGVGAHAGQERIVNDAFATLVDTSDAWISKRTGIRSRHVLKEGTSLRDISSSSGADALRAAGVDPKDIELVIMATSSPDDLFGDAASVAYALGATNAAAFDLTAACSGFVYGIVTASQFIQSGAYKKVLVIGADALTRWTCRHLTATAAVLILRIL